MLKSWLENYGKFSSSTCDLGKALKALIEKSIAPGKPHVKKLAHEVLLLFFERGNQAQLQEVMSQNLHNKNPKVITATL